jgi:hypothetical protein
MQGKTFTIEPVRNGYVIRDVQATGRNLGEMPNTSVARGAGEAKIVLRDLFEDFLEGLDLTSLPKSPPSIKA